MASFEELKIIDLDHLEFAVRDVKKSAEFFLGIGFHTIGERVNHQRKLYSSLLGQNEVMVVLSQSEDPTDRVSQYIEKHGEGVLNIAYRTEDAFLTFKKVTERGALPLEPPKSMTRDFGSLENAYVRTFGDVSHSFISRKGAFFDEGFEHPFAIYSNGSAPFLRIDHITTNVEAKKSKEWADFYERVFGFKNTRFFDIRTEKTGLYSYVMQSPNSIIKMPFNEPTEKESQIQEFLDVNHGPGIQHIAFLTRDIFLGIKEMKNGNVSFLDAPPNTYYDALKTRIPNLTEDISSLQSFAALADGDSKGYLLQIFTQTVMGPLFYEVIQRKGNDGFGEGNFAALFEAMERDQIRRGVLK